MAVTNFITSTATYFDLRKNASFQFYFINSGSEIMAFIIQMTGSDVRESNPLLSYGLHDFLHNFQHTYSFGPVRSFFLRVQSHKEQQNQNPNKKKNIVVEHASELHCNKSR